MQREGNKLKTRKEIKAEARDVLGHSLFCNKWVMFLAVELVFSIIMSVLGYTLIGVILLAGPFMYALAKAELKAVRRETETATFDTVGDGFKNNNFIETLLLYVMQSIFLFLWTLLFIIPGLIKSYSYSMAFYLKVDHPEYSWNDAITESRKLMNGHKWDLFIQDLSFLGWVIVGLLLCGIGILWVVPYMQASRAIFYNELVGGTKVEEAPAEDVVAIDAPADAE